MDLPEITEVKRLSLRPGDRVVLRFDDVLNPEQVEEVQEAMRHAFGDLDPMPKVIVLDGGADIEVVSPEPDGSAARIASELRQHVRSSGTSVQSVLGAGA